MSAVAKVVRSATSAASRKRNSPTSVPKPTDKVVALPLPAEVKAAAPVVEEDKALVSDVRVDHNADQGLVTRAQAGETIAFEMLVRKYQNRVIQLVQRLVGEADAPDVAQESFIKAYRALNSFRGQSAFYTWLYRIAINTAKNHLVSRSRRPASQDLDVSDAEKYGHEEHLSDLGTPEACLLADEIQGTLETVMEKLPADLRSAIILREMEGLSYEEISVVMKCPIGTVRSRIFRAREAIDLAVNPLLAVA
jgi:RNA polymerase sigma-70 factor (ECF subfamily)